MSALSINIRDYATPQLRAVITALKSRRTMNRMVGRRVQVRCREHLLQIAATRHTTARELGAKPSGFYGQAADQVAMGKSLTVDDTSAEISMNHPGLVRAFRDVTILPGEGKKYLTLPVVPEAYSNRAIGFRSKAGGSANFLRLRFRIVGGKPKAIGLEESPRTLIRFGRKKKNGARDVFAQAIEKLRLFYKFITKAEQKQDRTLLPSDAEIGDAAVQGAKDYLESVLQRRA